jgi:hypothetical protein
MPEEPSMSGPFSQGPPVNQATSARSTAVESGSPIPVPRKLLMWLTYGTAGTVLFPVIYLIEGATRPDYNALQQAISALSLGPDGWIQQVNFALCGVSVLWLAFVWRQILRDGVCATLYPIIRGIEGVGLVAIAIFSQDPGYGYPPGAPAGAGPSTLGGTLHLSFTILVVQAMCLGLLVIAWRLWKTPHLRGWAAFSLACGLLPMVFMPFFVLAQNNPHSALAGYAGLFERLATNADTIWGTVLLIPLWAGKRLMRP